MSLIRLLTVGRSLRGLADEPAPYRVNKRGLLPRFNSGKSPFAVPNRPKEVSVCPNPTTNPAEAGVEGEIASKPAAVAPISIELGHQDGPFAAPAHMNIHSAPLNTETSNPVAPSFAVARGIPEESTASAPVAAPPFSSWRVGRPKWETIWVFSRVVWQSIRSRTGRILRLLNWRRNPFGNAVPRSGRRTAQQTELSLDLVKPVRNDLADADVEVIPPRRPAGGTTRPESPHPTTKEGLNEF